MNARSSHQRLSLLSPPLSLSLRNTRHRCIAKSRTMLSGQVQWWIWRASLFGIQLVRAAYRSVHCSLELQSEGIRAADSRFTRRFQKAAPFCRGRGIYIHGWWIPVGVLESWICVRWDVMNSCWNQLSEFWREVYSFFIYVIRIGK